MQHTLQNKAASLAALLAACALACGGTARASTAYGSINNFDTVNDTGHECHGFEIELEDITSTDITYTYDWNHYGKSKLSTGPTAAGKPATFVRWESAKNADGTWAAYTAIPAGPILPTDGHQFTNPAVNFGGEHFGCGYTKNPTAVRYFWLLDQGGVLVRGPEVQVATPVFNYAPPVGVIAAQVQAVIVPPVPEAPPPREFGDPVWVKEIRTTSHNNNEVKLRDLVSDDPNDPNDRNWRNGEPDEIEVEWQILQKDYNAGNGGANGELAAAAEALPGGDEVVTRRYEFFKYVGPIDNETGEAMGDKVAVDGIHGVGTKTINGVVVDLSTAAVVGDYIGAQMSAFDAAASVGLIDQLPDGELGVEYTARTVVVAGAAPFTSTIAGALPQGMNYDAVAGVLSGMPAESGTFNVTISADDGSIPAPSKSYSFIIARGGVVPPPTSTVDTTAMPAGSGTTTGDGIYENGTDITVSATASAGFVFENWTDNGAVVSSSASYTFTTTVNRSLVAHFKALPGFTVSTSASPAELGSTSGDGTFANGASATVTATATAGAAFVSWTEGGNVVSQNASYTFTVSANRALVANFTSVFNITTSSSPAAGGVTSGGGAVNDGTGVTVAATPNAGFAFVNWTEAGAIVSANASYSFTATSDRSLVANFVPTVVISTAAQPVEGGTATGSGTVNAGSNVTVTAIPNANFAFVNWTEAGAIVSTNASYSFTATASRALIANFQAAVVVVPAGTFKGIVANLAAPTPEGTGLLRVTASGLKGGFTARLLLGASKYSFKGAFDAAGHATATILRRGQTPLAVDLQVNPALGIAGSVTDGAAASTFTARRCPYSKANPLADWPGTFTHMIGFPRHLRPPLPIGTGTHTIAADGSVRIAGRLSDGTSYSCSSRVTDAGTIPLYDATKLNGFAGFIVSDVTLNAANIGSITAGSPLAWKPATPQAFGRFAFFMDRYTPPARGQTALMVDAGVPNLDILATNSIGGMLASWQMMLKPNNTAVDLGAGPGPISLSITASTGVFSGKLNDGTVQRPFTGVVWQSVNGGFGILPGFGDQASLTIFATYTGP